MGTGTALSLALGQQLVLVLVGVSCHAEIVRCGLGHGAGTGACDHSSVPTRRVREVTFVELCHFARTCVDVCRWFLHGAPLVLGGHCELATRSSPTEMSRLRPLHSIRHSVLSATVLQVYKYGAGRA